MKDYTHIPSRPANWKPPVPRTEKTREQLWQQWRLNQQAASDYLDKIGRRGSYSRGWVEREETKELIQNHSI